MPQEGNDDANQSRATDAGSGNIVTVQYQIKSRAEEQDCNQKS